MRTPMQTTGLKILKITLLPQRLLNPKFVMIEVFI